MQRPARCPRSISRNDGPRHARPAAGTRISFSIRRFGHGRGAHPALRQRRYRQLRCFAQRARDNPSLRRGQRDQARHPARFSHRLYRPPRHPRGGGLRSRFGLARRARGTLCDRVDFQRQAHQDRQRRCVPAAGPACLRNSLSHRPAIGLLRGFRRALLECHRQWLDLRHRQGGGHRAPAAGSGD